MPIIDDVINEIRDMIITEESVRDVTSCAAFASRLRAALKKISNAPDNYTGVDSELRVAFRKALTDPESCTTQVNFAPGKITISQRCNLRNYITGSYRGYECERTITFSLSCIDGVDYLVVDEKLAEGRNNIYDNKKHCFANKEVRLFDAKEVSYFVANSRFSGFKTLPNNDIHVSAVANSLPDYITPEFALRDEDVALTESSEAVKRFDACKLSVAKRSQAGGTVTESTSEYKKVDQFEQPSYTDSKYVYGVNTVGDGYPILIAKVAEHKSGRGNDNGVYEKNLDAPIVHRIDENGRPLSLEEAVADAEVLYQRSAGSLNKVVRRQRSNTGSSIAV